MEVKSPWGSPHTPSLTRTHYIHDGGCSINPGSRTWTTWSPATLNGEEEWGGNKPFCFEPLRFGSRQPILTDAEIEHNRCSDGGRREAKGDEQRDKGGIRDLKVGDHDNDARMQKGWLVWEEK